MRLRRAQARIVRSRDDVALLDERAQSLDLLEQEDRERGGAAWADTRSRMGPGDDRASLRWWIALRNDDDTRNEDGLALNPGRAVEHAVCSGAERRAIDDLLSDKRAGLARKLGSRRV